RNIIKNVSESGFFDKIFDNEEFIPCISFVNGLNESILVYIPVIYHARLSLFMLRSYFIRKTSEKPVAILPRESMPLFMESGTEYFHIRIKNSSTDEYSLQKYYKISDGEFKGWVTTRLMLNRAVDIITLTCAAGDSILKEHSLFTE